MAYLGGGVCIVGFWRLCEVMDCYLVCWGCGYFLCEVLCKMGIVVFSVGNLGKLGGEVLNVFDC